MQPQEISCCFLFKLIQQLQSQVSCCFGFWAPSNHDSNKCKFLTSVDCWVIFYRSQKWCFSHHSQQLFQVDWCIGFWKSTFCSIYFWKHFHLLKWIKSWGSMGTSNLISLLFSKYCGIFFVREKGSKSEEMHVIPAPIKSGNSSASLACTILWEYLTVWMVFCHGNAKGKGINSKGCW